MRGVRVRPSGLVLGGLLVLLALAGELESARQADQDVRTRTDAALARSAARFLSVVVPPGPANGYDPARLLASVNTLARASFWSGGFQLAVGSVPLLPDTVGLVPVPDSLLLRLDAGDSLVVARYASVEAALVPFLDRDGYGILGWAAAWEVLEGRVPSRRALLLAAVGVATLGLLVVALLAPWRVRWLFFLLAGATQVVLALELRSGVEQTVRDSASLRVLTLKRLIEVAATAPGVRQALLPEIAAGARVREARVSDSIPADEVWVDDRTGEVVTRAATPRTGDVLELALMPELERVLRLDRLLVLWLGTGLLGLTLLALAVRYSSSPTD